MKIKLALLDSDQNYLNRIVTAFNIKYADKLEIYSFTKLESAMAALEPSRIDVLVASDTFVVESSALPKRCQLAYFVESADVDSVNDQAGHLQIPEGGPDLPADPQHLFRVRRERLRAEAGG